MLLDTIFGFLTKPLNTVLKRTIPDVSVRDKIKHELNLELIKMPFEEKMAFEKRLQMEAEHPNLLRDSVRPVITYICFGIYSYVKLVTIYYLSKIYFPMLDKMTHGPIDHIWTNLDKIKSLLTEFVRSLFTESDFYILLVVLGFWFSSKLFERVIDKVAKTGGIAGLFMGLKKGMNSIK